MNTENNVTPITETAKSSPNHSVGFDDEISRKIQERVTVLNETFTHVVNNGKNYVCRVSKNQLNKQYLEFFNIKEFQSLLLNEPKIVVGYKSNGDPILKPISTVWLEHPQKSLCQHGIAFHPINERFYKGKLNTYFGLGVLPAPYDEDGEDLEIYLAHIRDVICSGSEEYYTYLVKWMAHMVQKPEEKPEVAIILKAGQGTGKGSFVSPLGKIISAHYAHPQKADHVVGRFNNILENCVLLFADEFFAGSKKVTDTLKGMITEKTTTIERKGIDPVEVNSFTRIIMASNHENIVSIEKDERRYFYLEVSEHVKQNSQYFDRLHAVIGETESDQSRFAGKLLAYLLDVDLTGYHPRQVPKTEALKLQKLDNLDAADSWIYSVLMRGTFATDSILDNEGTKVSEARLSTSKTIEFLEAWEKRQGRVVFGDKARVVGRILSKLGVNKKDNGSKAKSRFTYEFPPLREMKDRFCEYIGTEIEW